MKVRSRYDGDRRTVGLLTLKEAERGFAAFRLVPELQQGQQLTELPRVPETAMWRPDRHGRSEDTSTPRVALGKSILGCVAGIVGGATPKRTERWLTEPQRPHFFDDNSAAWHARDVFDEHWVVFGLRRGSSAALVPSAEVAHRVPDAMWTGEVWSREPVALERVGALVRLDDYRGGSLWVRPDEPGAGG